MPQPKIVVVYASNNGHTEQIANAVAKGAGVHADVKVHKLSELTDQLWEDCMAADGIIFGSATYMGNVASEFQKFAEATSDQWFHQRWKDKIAAGFTNSGSPSGDKVATLQSMATLAAQHSMVWVSNGIFPSVYSGDGKNFNRFGFYLGLGTQATNDAASATNPAPEDQETAELFGARVAKAALRWKRGA